MPKFKLIKDLPFQKADDTEWGMIGTYGKIINNYPEPIYFIKEGTTIKWPIDWGDPLTSGWFEEVKPKRWRAEKEGKYFYLRINIVLPSLIAICESTEHFFWESEANFEIGNYFKTKEQAEAATQFILEEYANRIKKLLAELQEEINKG